MLEGKEKQGTKEKRLFSSLFFALGCILVLCWGLRYCAGVWLSRTEIYIAAYINRWNYIYSYLQPVGVLLFFAWMASPSPLVLLCCCVGACLACVASPLRFIIRPEKYLYSFWPLAIFPADFIHYMQYGSIFVQYGIDTIPGYTQKEGECIKFMQDFFKSRIFCFFECCKPWKIKVFRALNIYNIEIYKNIWYNIDKKKGREGKRKGKQGGNLASLPPVDRRQPFRLDCLKRLLLTAHEWRQLYYIVDSSIRQEQKSNGGF